MLIVSLVINLLTCRSVLCSTGNSGLGFLSTTLIHGLLYLQYRSSWLITNVNNITQDPLVVYSLKEVLHPYISQAEVDRREQWFIGK